MTTGLVSVVIPVFNGERHLGEALDSVRAQSYPSVEVIVVDDGSNDGTAAVISAHPDAICVQTAHRGAPAARNAGVRVARGEFLAFLDSDDLMPPNKLALQVEYLRAQPHVGCVLGAQRVFSLDASVDATWMETMPEWMRWAPDWERRGQVQPMSMVVRREVFDHVGPFDERLRVSDDIDWVLRATEAAVGLHVLDEIVLHRRAHEANLSRDESAQRRYHFMVLKARIDRKRSTS